MSLSYTHTAVDASGSQSSSTTINIPAGTQLIVVSGHWYSSGNNAGMTSITIGGSALTSSTNFGSSVNDSDASGGLVFYLASPTTGNGITFAWNWGAGGARTEGGRLKVTFHQSDTGTATFRASGGDSKNLVTTVGPVVIASSTTDQVFGYCQSFSPTNPDFGVTGQTVVENDIFGNSEVYDFGTVNSPGASTTSVSMTSLNYSGLVAYSVQESGGGGGGSTRNNLMLLGVT